jgi:S1-C subfamily serine protease
MSPRALGFSSRPELATLERPMSSRALVVVLLACTIGYIAGREGGQSLRVWTPIFARVSAATTPPEERAAGITRPAPPTSGTPEVSGDLTADERRIVEVFRRASASVVHIANITVRQDLFSFDVLQIQQGTGSGFVWDRGGHIVTNLHVLEGGDNFRVRLADQSEYEAKVIRFRFHFGAIFSP